LFGIWYDILGKCTDCFQTVDGAPNDVTAFE